MQYFLSEEQQMIVDLAQQVAQKIKPMVAEYDEKEEFPHEIVKELAKVDLFAVLFPEEYGGISGNVMDLCLAVEELGKVCGAVATTYAANALGTLPITIGGSEEQKSKFLPPVAAGEKLAAFALTEPNAGSDVSAVATTAIKDGDHYILNGTKQWITNGGVADIYTVFAATDKSRGARGFSFFVVEKGTEGFSFGKKEQKLGIRSSATSELIFEDCRVPAENLIGREGSGFTTAMKTFDHSRPGVGAMALGIAQGAFDEAMNFAREREQFGSSVSAFQGVQFMLADMATQIEAARSLIYSVARMIDGGVKKVSKEAAMAKLFASDVAMKVTVDAVQVMGGYGYMRDFPVEKMMRDAKITQIYEGTNQIQRSIIALNLIKEYASKK